MLSLYIRFIIYYFRKKKLNSAEPLLNGIFSWSRGIPLSTGFDCMYVFVCAMYAYRSTPHTHTHTPPTRVVVVVMMCTIARP